METDDEAAGQTASLHDEEIDVGICQVNRTDSNCMLTLTDNYRNTSSKQ